MIMLGLVAAVFAGSAAAGPPHLTADVAPAPCGGQDWSAFVYDGAYSPKALRLSAVHTIGGKVTWRWDTLGGNSFSASVTYRGKLALFDSGVKTATVTTLAPTYSHNFVAAGTYLYYSKSDTSQQGSISVPLCNVPSTARVNRMSWVQTATKPLAGTAEDVEVKRPGATQWRWLKTGFKGEEFSWTPTSTGTYRLRGRLRRLSNNTASRFSPISTIRVS
jgi:plastocyanin